MRRLAKAAILSREPRRNWPSLTCTKRILAQPTVTRPIPPYGFRAGLVATFALLASVCGAATDRPTGHADTLLSIHVTMTKAVYLPDEPIVAQVSLENTGDDYVKINLTSEGELFRFRLTGPAGLPLKSSVRRAGMHRVNFVGLPPRHSVCWRMDLRKRFPALESPPLGQYRISASYVGVQRSSEEAVFTVSDVPQKAPGTSLGSASQGDGGPEVDPLSLHGRQWQRVIAAREGLRGRALDWQATKSAMKEGELTFAGWAEQVDGVGRVSGAELKTCDLGDDHLGVVPLVTGAVAAIWYQEFVASWATLPRTVRDRKLAELGGSIFKKYAFRQLTRVRVSLSSMLQRWPKISVAREAGSVLRDLESAEYLWRGAGLLPMPVRLLNNCALMVERSESATDVGVITYPILSRAGILYRAGPGKPLRFGDPAALVRGVFRWRRGLRETLFDLAEEDRTSVLRQTGLFRPLPELDRKSMLVRKAYHGPDLCLNVDLPRLPLDRAKWRNDAAGLAGWLQSEHRLSPWRDPVGRAASPEQIHDLVTPWLVPALAARSQQWSFEVFLLPVDGVKKTRIPTGWVLDVVVPAPGAEFKLTHSYEVWQPAMGFVPLDAATCRVRAGSGRQAGQTPTETVTDEPSGEVSDQLVWLPGLLLETATPVAPEIWPGGKGRFVRLRYAGNWDQDLACGTDTNMLRQFHERTDIECQEGAECIQAEQLGQLLPSRCPPFLYITGKGGIDISGKGVSALREYLLAKGGMLFADNGGGHFDAAIRRLVAKLFPGAEWQIVRASDQVYASKYDLSGRVPPTWRHSGFRGLGIRNGGRWLVFYYQADLKATWRDEPGGATDEEVESAYRLGVNVMCYAAATQWRYLKYVKPHLREAPRWREPVVGLREPGAAEATLDRRKLAKQTGYGWSWPGGKARFVRLRYAGGNWDRNMSSGADAKMLRQFQRRTGIACEERAEHVELDQLGQLVLSRCPPFLYITGKGKIDISDGDVSALREYLLTKGGMLFADSSGSAFDASLQQFMSKILPRKQWVDIAGEDELCKWIYRLPLPASGTSSGESLLAGLRHQGRWIALYSRSDMSGLWGGGESGVSREKTELAYQAGVNVMHYSFVKHLDHLASAALPAPDAPGEGSDVGLNGKRP